MNRPPFPLGNEKFQHALPAWLSYGAGSGREYSRESLGKQSAIGHFQNRYRILGQGPILLIAISKLALAVMVVRMMAAPVVLA